MDKQEAKYTPGPWSARAGDLNSDPRWWIFVNGDPLNTICLTSQDNDEANAHLLAASPLMLEVLQEIEWVEDEEYWKKFCPSCQEFQSYGHKDDCKLAAAIKAALNLDQKGQSK